jgi:hypothetical protein
VNKLAQYILEGTNYIARWKRKEGNGGKRGL